MFNIAKWFRKDDEKRSSQHESCSLTHPQARRLLSDFRVNPLAIPAVMRGTKLIADNASKVNLNTFKKGANNSREVDKRHPTWKVFRKPNPFQTMREYLNLELAHAVIHGNAYSRIYRNRFFEPTDLIPLDPCKTHPVVENNILYYATWINGKLVKLNDFEVIHIKGLMADEYMGHSLVELMSSSFAYSSSLVEYGYQFFKNGGMVQSVVTIPKSVWTNEDERKEFISGWREAHSNVGNVNKDAFIGEGFAVAKQAASNDESQFLGAREQDLVNVANILGVPSHFLGNKTSNAYNSAIAEKQALMDLCLDGWLVNLEQQFEMKLLTEDELENDTHYIEFNRKRFIGMDAELENRLLISYYTNNLLSWQETRSKMNESTLRDPNQDWFMAANIVKQEEKPVEVPPETPEATPDDSKRSIALASIERLGRRLERSNKKPIEHLQVFVETLPTLKDECRDILMEVSDEWNESTKKKLVKVVVEELCQII